MARVLVVDDEQTVQYVLKSFLETDGHQVLTAANFDDAVTELKREPADLVVTDVVLGKRTGLDILTLVKEEQPQTPVIVITGQPTVDTATRCVRAGAFDLLQKPLEHDNFIDATRRAIKEGRRQKRIGTLALENRRHRRLLGEQVERKNFEIERATKALIRSEQRYRMLVEAVPEIILEFDKKFRCIWYNEVALRFFGESLYNKPIEFFSSANQQKRELTEKVKLLQSRPLEAVPFKFHARRGDGENRWTSWTIKSLVKPSGEIYGFLATARDITDIARLEEELRRKAKLETIGQLAGGVAHDFNNMLSGIMAQTHVLQRLKNHDPAVCDSMRIIESCVSRAKELTSKLLGFAQCGKTKNCPFSIHEIVKEVVTLLERTLDKKIAITTNLQASLDTVYGDPTQIYQVILNLCVNSRDAILERFNQEPHPEQKGIIQISSRLEPKPFDEDGTKSTQKIIIEVSDDGCGIPAELKDRIFEPFFTTKKQLGNSGMGLAMVYGIVSNHDGTVKAENRTPLGSKFSVSLPITKELAVGNTEIERPSAPVAKSKGTVLLIDDEDLVRSSMAALLRSLGYETFCATSGDEAIEIYKTAINMFDVVILDMMMPGMSVENCVRKLKELRPELQIVLTSGYGLSDLAARLMSTGVDSFLQKPCPISDLSETLSKICAKNSADSKDQTTSKNE